MLSSNASRPVLRLSTSTLWADYFAPKEGQCQVQRNHGNGISGLNQEHGELPTEHAYQPGLRTDVCCADLPNFSEGLWERVSADLLSDDVEESVAAIGAPSVVRERPVGMRDMASRDQRAAARRNEWTAVGSSKWSSDVAASVTGASPRCCRSKVQALPRGAIGSTSVQPRNDFLDEITTDERGQAKSEDTLMKRLVPFLRRDQHDSIIVRLQPRCAECEIYITEYSHPHTMTPEPPLQQKPSAWRCDRCYAVGVDHVLCTSCHRKLTQQSSEVAGSSKVSQKTISTCTSSPQCMVDKGGHHFVAMQVLRQTAAGEALPIDTSLDIPKPFGGARQGGKQDPVGMVKLESNHRLENTVRPAPRRPRGFARAVNPIDKRYGLLGLSLKQHYQFDTLRRAKVRARTLLRRHVSEMTERDTCINRA